MQQRVRQGGLSKAAGGAEKKDSAMLHKAVKPLLDRGPYEDGSGHFFPPFDKQNELVP